MAPRRSASARWIAQPVSLEPVKATPATRVSLTSAAPTAPLPGSRCRTLGGTPASCSSCDGEEGRDRRLLGGLGEHRIAGRQRRRHLAREDGEREVPGRDAGERRRGPLSSSVLRLAGRARSDDGPGEQPARLRRVVAQEVDGLAHVALRVLQRLAGLAHHDGHEARAVALVEIGGAVENLRALWAAEPVPGVPGRVRAGDGRSRSPPTSAVQHRADALVPVVRAQHQLDAVRRWSTSGRR